MVDHPDLLTVRVGTIRFEAEGVIGLELVTPDGKNLPAFSAGSHVDLHLPNGVTRCYSLMNTERELTHYRFGVLRDQESSGGSSYIHDELRVGQLVAIGLPRNNFPVDLTAAHSLIFAGGIGVTPFRSMLDSLNNAQRSWTMYYCARAREKAAFITEFEQLTKAGNGQLILHFDDEQGKRILDMARIVSDASPGTHFYCCGPAPMMQAYKNACADQPDHHIHRESFKAEQEPDKQGGFFISLARSGGRIAIPPGKTILDILLERGIPITYSCQQGICGSCEVKVLAGEPDHRDAILSDDEKARNDTIMVCCSGAKSAELILDL